MPRHPWLIGGLVLLFAPIARPAEVQQELWGFDGRVTLGAFNPLSIYVYNGDDEPFEGEMVLRKDSGAGPLGARLVEPCYLSPGTGRWITFYPYVNSQFHSWNLSWGRGRGERKELNSPPVGPPAVVFLWSDRLRRPPAELRAFDPARFPAAAGATDGLGAVVMDTIPEWNPAQREAFRIWLAAGGELHILTNPGTEMTFSGDLAELNNPLPTFRIGTGTVHRHGFTRAELDEQRLDAMGLRASPSPREAGEQIVADDTRAPDGSPSAAWQFSPLEQMIFQSLQSLVRPDHNWSLIYTAAFIFLLLVGPINGWLSRRRLTFRGSLLFVCGVVAAFSFGFYKIGQRGYGERTVVHKIAYARALGAGGGDGYDVLQYATAFVTRGDEYRITHDAKQNLYATAQNHEAVRGVIRSPATGGSFDVDIPVYSWRSFVHRGTFALEPITVTVEQWPTGEGLDGLVLALGDGFPAQPERIWAVRSDRWANLPSPVGQTITMRGATVDSHTMLNLAHHRQFASYYQQYQGYNPWGQAPGDATPEKVIPPLVPPLIASRLGVLQHDASGPLTGPDHIQLFIVASAPEALSIRSEGFGDDHGYVIYHLDIFKPAGDNP